MAANHVVLRADEATYGVPELFRSHAAGFEMWRAISASTPSAHMGFLQCRMEPDGHVAGHLHSYESSFYVVSGEVICDHPEGSFLLRAGDYGLIGVGAPHGWRGAGTQTAHWVEMLAPQPRDGQPHTFLVDGPIAGDAQPVDPRDPRCRSFGHIEASNMEVDTQTQDQLAQSASMRTALLVYSGITVKMMVDSDLGADLSTMFMVQYEPGGFAGAHDHPLEEAYLVLDGRVDATFDGVTYRMEVGDLALAGVGCVHEFANPGPGTVRWLETQAPQPPARHSYRFARDWTYLAQRLED
jgi:quercetin dioxygenase-like cupin family protein